MDLDPERQESIVDRSDGATNEAHVLILQIENDRETQSGNFIET